MGRRLSRDAAGRAARAGFLVVACLSSASVGAAELPPGFTRAMIQGVPTRDLAIRLLGEGETRLGNISRHEVEAPTFRGGPLSAIHFFSDPRPSGADLCRQNAYFVGFAPIADDENAYQSDGPTRVSSLQFLPHLALAQDCRLEADHRFMRVSFPVTVEQAADALLTLARLRLAARGADAVRLPLDCRDETNNDRCADGGRPALAALPLHQAFSIERLRDGSEGVQIRMGPARGAQWTIRLPGGSSDNAITMLYSLPPPF